MLCYVIGLHSIVWRKTVQKSVVGTGRRERCI